MIKVLGLSGSLRSASCNTALLRAAAALMPPVATMDVATLHGIPLYDGDVEARDGLPASVQDPKARIVGCDGLLLAALGGRLMVSRAGQVFNGSGEMVDEKIKEQLQQFVRGFAHSLQPAS